MEKFTDEVLEELFAAIQYRYAMQSVAKDDELADEYLKDLKSFFIGKPLHNKNNQNALWGYILESISYFYDYANKLELIKMKKKASYLNKSQNQINEWISNKARDFKEFLESIG
ncbi:hypothetical protein [Nitratiruptor sp. SB155-2]|uniref:hypothetical protein n=1 Tax=Nitratiruptor sp. (strain SB155-2) TaxID=387092 RepID=UPI0001587312|nr:hypothetical protein [Nitratiruptor sp. SB155-2]BAF70437.1 hypothetical protein NIS_1329 [Nitratiruptor sp. SB155-2]